MRAWALLICILPTLAWAGTDLEQSSDLLKRMEYKKALKAVKSVIRSADAGPAELAEAYRIQGLCLAAINRQADAVKSFRRLLSLDPTFSMPRNISPKLRTSFYQAAGMARDQKPISISHSQPEVGEKLGGLKLRAKLEADPMRMVKGIRFRYLGKSNKVKELAVLVSGPKAISFKLPDSFKADTFKYWVEAFNKHGGVLARAGSQAEPFALKVKAKPKPILPPVIASGTGTKADQAAVAATGRPPSDGPSENGETVWYKTWWFWTTVGVVAAGAVTGGVLAATSGGDDPDPLHWEIQVQ